MKTFSSKKSKLCALAMGCLIMLQGFGQIAFADTTQQEQDYELSGRDYIKLPSLWKGNSSGDGILQTNIYPDSEPLIKRVGNTNVLVWLADDASRNAVNRTSLMYSIQTVSGGTWSSPLPIDNDGTADFYPNLATDGTDIFVTWQNVNKKFEETEATLEKLSQASEIKVSKFNKASNSFGTPVKLTENNVLDQTPVAAVSNGKAYVSWVSNDANDLFGINGKSSIMFSQYDGTAWKPAKKLADCSGILISMSATAISDKLCVAYSMDTDKKLETLGDREIYYANTDGSTVGLKQLTSNNIIDSKPEMITRNNKASVFWYEDKKIKYVEDIFSPVIKDFLPEPLDGYNDNFKVAYDKDNICLMWTRQINGSVEVFGAFYDTIVNEMTSIVKLTDTKQRIISFDGVYDGKGELYIVCNKAQKIEKTLEGNTYYESGLSDLFVTKIAWETNGFADIASVQYNESDFYPGKQMPITFDFKNIGNKAINKLVIEAYDGNPFNGGRNLNQNTTINGYIKPGNLKNITVNFTPEEARKYDLYLKVVVDDNADIDMTDNIIYADFGYCDIVLDKLTVMGNGDSKTLVVTVKNTSNFPAKDVVITGKEDSMSGKDILKKGPFVIKEGQQQQIICNINTKDLVYDKDGVKIIYVVLTTTCEEKYTSNNSTSFMLTNRLSSIPLELMVLNKANNRDKISVEAAVGNHYTSKITGNIIAELCEKTSDKILETKQQITTIDANQFSYVNLEFSKNAPYTGSYYLRINIAKTGDSSIPESITKLCNQLVFDLPIYQNSGNGGNQGGGDGSNQNGGSSGGVGGGSGGGTGGGTGGGSGGGSGAGGNIPIPNSNIPGTQQPSNNAKISSLKINKGTLSPAFDKNIALYDLTLASDVKEIRISASTENAMASLIVDGVNKPKDIVDYLVSIPDGKTKLEIKVKAENGDIKTYIININRTTETDNEQGTGQFSDVTDHWAKEYILSLANLGIMSGYPDKTFRPDNKITRAEAAVVLIKVFNQLPTNNSKLSFSDEAKIPSWSYGYIKTAVDRGWIKGYDDKTFKPGNLITRQEFAVMFLRAMEYKDMNAVKTSFNDDNKIGSWSRGYIAKAVELGLITGYQDKTFRPGGNISRAEVCVIAKKYLDKK